VTVRYYDHDRKKPEEGEQGPLYAMSFEMFENGRCRAKIVLDYNEFVFQGARKVNVKDAKRANDGPNYLPFSTASIGIPRITAAYAEYFLRKPSIARSIPPSVDQHVGCRGPRSPDEAR